MPLKTFVKVGRITNLSDARYCAGMGADLLGFQVIAGHENYVSAAAFQEMRGWITGPAVVAEIYGVADMDALQSIIDNYKPDYFELADADLARLGNTLPLPYILATNNATAAESLHQKPAYILVAAGNGPTSIPALAAIKDKAEVMAALEQPHIQGIALNGSAEIRPGLKDFESLAEILEALEEE